MTKRYFFHIGYHGFNYRGWQRQEGVISVQEVLETTLGNVLKEAITVVGCGRTDAKVSATQYFFHIDTGVTWDFDLKYRLNKALPPDISIFDIVEVDEKQHARFSVTERSYTFFFHTYKDPFLVRTSSFYLIEQLDFEKMKEAVALFPRYDNYGVFCKSPDKHNTTICKVSSASLHRDKNGERYRLEITANRFLKSMIRILLGKLLEVGKGEFSVEEFEHCLKTQTPPKTILPAHPQGLYLSRVTYPFLDIAPRTGFAGTLLQLEDTVKQTG